MFRWMPWDLHEFIRHTPELIGEFSEAELETIKRGSSINPNKEMKSMDELEEEEERVKPKKHHKKNKHRKNHKKNHPKGRKGGKHDK